MSDRCAPCAAEPAAASRPRSSASAGPQPILHRQRRLLSQAVGDRVQPSASRATGNRPAAPAASTAFSRDTSTARAAVTATACRAMLSSTPASQAGSAPAAASSRLRLDIAVS